MGIFSDNVRRYYERGLITIPCKDKRPILGQNWQKYCEIMPTEEQIDKWELEFKDAQQLGLTLGQSTQIAGFDLDYEYDEKKSTLSKADFAKDKKLVEKQILSLLPPTPAIKSGKKGWTRLYKVEGKLENAQCDRNGIRLFDFLANNKQTIIPPSKYNDGTDIFYRWIGSPLEDCLDDIPLITQDIINEIKLLLGDSQNGYDFEANGRHGRLLKWLLDVVKIEPDNKKVASKLVELDIKTNTIPYLSDPKHFSKYKQPEANALEWIKRVRKFANVEGSGAKTPIGEDGWNYFFENAFKIMKKDIISKEVFIKKEIKDDWLPIRALEDVLRAYANKAKLTFSQTADQLARWIFEKNEMDFLCDVPKWDGIDRVRSFGDSLQSYFFSGEQISDIIKHWGSNIFRRIDSPEYQNRCIILKGNQGIGKDSLVRSMLRDFIPYYESTTLPGTQKDILEIVSRLLVVHIEEFDQTRGIDIAFLKSLITQPSAFFRESYGFSPNKKIMRPSFISTANVDDFLRDPTGNRRFIILPIHAIKWDYPRGDSLQVIAQFKHYFEAKQYELLSTEIEAKIKEIVDAYTPSDLSEAIIEMYRQRFFAITSHEGSYSGLRSLTYPILSKVFADIAKDLQCSVRRVQAVIKSKGYAKRVENGMIYFAENDEKNVESL